MVVNADQLLDELKGKNEIDGAMFKMKNDPRIKKSDILFESIVLMNYHN